MLAGMDLQHWLQVHPTLMLVLVTVNKHAECTETSILLIYNISSHTDSSNSELVSAMLQATAVDQILIR